MSIHFHYCFVAVFISVGSFGLNAQTTFSNANLETGINHIYFNVPSEMGSGVAFFDYNNDNKEDLIFTGGDGPEILYKNNGDGSFTTINNSGINRPNGQRSIGVVTGDIDNDGFDDVVVFFGRNTVNRLYHNNGDGTFTDITVSSGIDRIFDGTLEKQQSFSAAMGDVNHDGFLDIYIANWIDTLGYLYDNNNDLIGFAHKGGENRLYINNGDLTFTESADVWKVQDQGCTLSSVFSDPDNDRDADVLMANDFGMWVIPDGYYRNEYPLDSFTDISAASGFDSQLYGMGVGIGDYDKDGDLDYYKTNIGRNVLLNNLGNYQFQDTTAFAGVEDTYINGQPPHLAAGWGAGFVDIDHDSNLDLVVANGRVGNPNLFPALDSLPDRLFKNNGDGTFTDIASASNMLNYGLSRGVAYGDYDNDGDVDVVFTRVANLNLFIPASPIVFKNNFQNADKNWLKVKLEGTTINRNAIGSHIIIKVNGESWVHEINSGGQGHTSQHSRVAHFGLDTASVIDSLIVQWYSPTVPDQIYTDIPANQMIKIVEGQSGYTQIHTTVSTKDYTPTVQAVQVFPNPATDEVQLTFDIETPEKLTIELVDLKGQLVQSFGSKTYNSGQHQQTLRFSDVLPGLYYILIRSRTSQVAKEILITR